MGAGVSKRMSQGPTVPLALLSSLCPSGPCPSSPEPPTCPPPRSLSASLSLPSGSTCLLTQGLCEHWPFPAHSVPWLSFPGTEPWRGTQGTSGAQHVPDARAGVITLCPELPVTPGDKVASAWSWPPTVSTYSPGQAGVSASRYTRILSLPMEWFCILGEGGRQPPAQSQCGRSLKASWLGTESPWLLLKAVSWRIKMYQKVGRKRAT